MILDTRSDVADFMKACDQFIADTPDKIVVDSIHTKKQVDLYMKLVIEEYTELLNAYIDNDTVEIADAIGDLIWVLIGMAHSKGIPLQKVWDEISRSNMSKIMPDGKVHKRPDGKVQKPETFSPADLSQFFGE